MLKNRQEYGNWVILNNIQAANKDKDYQEEDQNNYSTEEYYNYQYR